MSELQIPKELLPSDGRFGSGPSKIRTAQIDALASAGTTLLGTSHRQKPVRDLVASIQSGIRELFNLPEDYEVVLGNGGASAFWDIICASLIIQRAAVGSYGSFSGKLAASIAAAPFLDNPVVYEAPYGSLALPQSTPGADVYAWAHNETSTGVMAPVVRAQVQADHIAQAPNPQDQHIYNPLTIIDATSAAGGLPVDITQADVYYFSPQKAFGSEGGLWVAICSPQAIERAHYVEKLAAQPESGRWVPPFLSLTKAITNSRKNQTLNTPSISTLLLMHEQIQWVLAQGGLTWATERCAHNAQLLYTWAEQHQYLTPFVEHSAWRSNVVVTIDVDPSLDADDIIACLRKYGIVDIAGYRALGRNQLRIAVFPSVEPEDVQRLIQCVNVVIDHLIQH